MQKEEESKGQNVKVVLRCRPMTKSEASQEKQSLRCTSDKTVDVMYGKAGKKSFTFDGTFDESTSQKDMYDNVVRPVVDEVLQGYNCTVFAYGQTGTGKTYTMEGGIDKASGTTIPPSAGVVPRAVAQVFKHLEENEVEYQVRISAVELYTEELSDPIASSDTEAVRISVVELYNEELSDLIASSDTEAGMLRKLRLLEDPKKGVVLQGVEERPVTCAADIFSILECTNRQRKTAETLCNKQSSRSHSIFTLKIFMKEKMVDEEEIIKTGLLNLVDLAGSECVGRSGAQGDRKKEAGQINQSLLTLGRVITSLVERHVHVPYRESKLTRLLQESLGGRTKTIIIATVSPNSANIEETLSTLDYASRAKAIKNTPQINQVQTKKAMMRELAGSIADLQEQLRAQRDGTGVYLPTAKYEGMQTEMSRLRDMELAVQQELDEKQKLYDELSANFTETCETLADTRGTLALTEGTLRETEETLGATQVTLKDTEVALKDTEVTLENTTAVLDEHKEVGDKLYGEGSSLLEESEVMREEIGGLFSKIDRKAKVLDENEKIAREHQSSLAQQVMAAAEHLDAFRTTQASNFLSLQAAKFLSLQVPPLLLVLVLEYPAPGGEERVVAEFVVEKNSEIDTLKRTVASLQESASAAMDKQGEHVRGSTAEGIISLQATGKLAADQRDAEVALVQAGVAAMGAANAQVMSSLAAAKSGVTEWAEKALSGT
ncbi:P-loop containing nucleoside triphosphate hydrolase protein [Baffinella frigidus]|nr:P-loop containing nucleoside triphosphate hydrolase protein [Cryptophyta sp. CCMP2293]